MRHNLIAPLRSIPLVRRTLSAISIVLSFVFALAAFGVQLGTSFTYQGQLRRSGAAYTGTCNFQFSLWDAVSAGTQQGSTLAINSVSVANGLFTVALDFGASPFTGDARWLATSVQCSGDGGFTSLDPRQALTATPYALSLRPGAEVRGAESGHGVLNAFNSLPATAILGESPNIGVYGRTTGTAGRGVYGEGAGSGVGVYGISFGGGSAIEGTNNSGGLAGHFTGSVVVEGATLGSVLNVLNTEGFGFGVYGTGFLGVRGESNGNTGSVGVRGLASGTNSIGVYGSVSGSNTAGVLGVNSASPAIWGQSTGAGPAIYGQALSSGKAGEFAGSVNVQGTLTKAAGSFRIDHPLDPANKFLSHSFVESPDMKNIYDGNVTTDATGNATVTLPDYFAALNRDYRYQLTVLGQFAQAIVSREIAGNSFEIHTDKPGVKVSWQVTGIRQDAYAKEHPIVVEQFKPTEQQDKYLYPAGFGADEEKRIGHLQAPIPAPGPSSPASK